MYIPKNIHVADRLDYKITSTLFTQNSPYELHLNSLIKLTLYLEECSGWK